MTFRSRTMAMNTIRTITTMTGRIVHPGLCVHSALTAV